jgi:uncharacterized protein DUF3551
MRFLKKVMAALVLATAMLHAPGNRSLGATNCGFLTIEQCRATVSGIGGFCVPNQFYNPRRPAKDTRKRQEVRAYAMPYDPYRGAPNIRKVICKAPDVSLDRAGHRQGSYFTRKLAVG